MGKEEEKSAGEKPKHPMTDPKACQELKEKHDTCFLKWYNDKFLRGTITIDCKEEWEEYQYCLRVWLLFIYCLSFHNVYKAN